jgi:uncharacterized delta-60 repeat protein
VESWRRGAPGHSPRADLVSPRSPATDPTVRRRAVRDERYRDDHHRAVKRGDGVTLQSDGKIIAAGTALVDAGQNSNAFALGRYTSNGTLDASFGDAGTRTTMIGLSSGIDGISLQSEGKLVVVGTTRTAEGSDFDLARYLLSGN